MYARVAASNFRSLQVQRGQFPRPTERLTVRHNLRNHSPFVRGTRRQRLWVQQERLRSSRSSAVTPRRKDAVARRYARSEMRHLLESRALRCHNYAGKQRVVGVHMGASFDSRDDRHPYVGDIFQHLNTFVVNLAPNTGIGGVAKRWPVDISNELPASARQDHDLVGSVLRNAVEGVDKLRVSLRAHNERPAIGVEFSNQYAVIVSCQL